MRILLVTCLHRLIVVEWYNLELLSHLRLYRWKLNSLSDPISGEVTTAIRSVPGIGEREDWSGKRKEKQRSRQTNDQNSCGTEPLKPWTDHPKAGNVAKRKRGS
jgi:hypothetical protein